MDLLLLLKAGWTMIEVELSLPQCLCTFGKEKGFSLINPPTTFTIKGREWNKFFCCGPWFIHLGTFITIQLAFAFCSLTELSFSELLWGGKAKASTGDGQNSQAPEPGRTRCFILHNLETNQVPFFFFFLAYAQHQQNLLIQKAPWEGTWGESCNSQKLLLVLDLYISALA